MQWIFASKNGKIPQNLNSNEIEQLYNGFMSHMGQSYELMLASYNTYASRCLSDKQKRESGIELVGP